MEYYTMWVHQIKTPIAALKLLIEEDDSRGRGAFGSGQGKAAAAEGEAQG